MTVNVVVFTALFVGAPAGESPSGPAERDSLGIVLVSEAPGTDLRLRLPPAPPPVICRLWGAENDPAALRVLEQQLTKDEIKPAVVAREVDLEPKYRVIVGNLSTVSDRNNIVSALAAAKIDSYALKRRGNQFPISVGVYVQERFAKDQYEQISALGFDASLERIPRKETVFSLAAEVPAGSAWYKSSIGGCDTIASSD